LQVLHYLDETASPAVARVMVQDPWVKPDETRELYPSSPTSNDAYVTGCGYASMGDFHLRADGGQIIYKCDNSTRWRAHTNQDLTGRSDPVLVMGKNDVRLVANSSGALYLVRPDNSEVLVTGTGFNSEEPVVAVRARPTGFWVVRIDAASTPRLFLVGFDGVAALVGTYPASPSPSPSGRLNAHGDLFVLSLGPPEQVLRLRLGQSSGQVMYDEQNRDAGFKHYVRIEPEGSLYGEAVLLTGPGETQ